jgi:hypothetical protein
VRAFSPFTNASHGERTASGYPRLTLAIALGALSLSLASAAGAMPHRSTASFCGSVDGAWWVAKRQVTPHFVATYSYDFYWVWRKRVDCEWALRKVAFLTRALGTKYMSLADLRDFKCRTVRPNKHLHLLSLRPRRAQGECRHVNPNSVARFEWRPVIPRK